MTKQIPSHELNDRHEQETIDAIKEIYQQNSKEMPDVAIDRQILAAAQRELNSPNPGKKLEISWWRRLSLPLYAAAVFTFTAIGAHWYWPAPVRVPPGTSPGPVVIDIMSDESVMNDKLAEPQIQPRKMLKMPEKKPLQVLPVASQTEQQTAENKLMINKNKLEAVMPQTGLSQALKFKVEEPVRLSVTGSRSVIGGQEARPDELNKEGLPNNAYPDKEQWVREIIEMLKKGEHQAAQKELIQFKKTFPDYPVDDQIEAFRR